MTDENKNNQRIIASVIIPTYKRHNSLKNTLESLIQQKENNIEIIVVDNEGSKFVKNLVKEFNNLTKKKIHYFFEEQLGLHFARNRGAYEASAEILVYTDDDTLFTENWLKEILRPFQNKNIGAVGGKVLPKWESPPPDWVFDFSSGNLSLLDYSDKPQNLDEGELMIYGCNMAIRKGIVLENGGFHPELIGSNYYIGDGESGFLRKIQKIGWVLFYTPHAILFHVIPSYRLTEKYFYLRYQNQGASDKYTQYHERFPSRWILIKDSFESLLRFIAHRGLYLFYKLMRKDKWREHFFKSGYEISKVKYGLRLFYDLDFRELVQKKNWF